MTATCSKHRHVWGLCSNRRCFARIQLTLEEYEEAQSDPQRYLTISGHEVAGALAIAQDERFALAKKL